MSECVKLATCPFFNDKMKGLEGMANLYKKRFCKGEFELCARWRVAQTGIPVPGDLFPNQEERVEGIVSAAKAAG